MGRDSWEKKKSAAVRNPPRSGPIGERHNEKKQIIYITPNRRKNRVWSVASHRLGGTVVFSHRRGSRAGTMVQYRFVLINNDFVVAWLNYVVDVRAPTCVYVVQGLLNTV